MKVKCFACATLLEAPDADRLADAFVAHVHASHPGAYPEQAVRNYAHNIADALERLSADTERRPAIGAIAVHPVTEERVDDWLRLFDRDAFAGNPDWASCYCLEPHLPPDREASESPWRETRATMVGRLRCRATFGYLAYVDDHPAGWVNASLRSESALFGTVDPEGPAPDAVIAVSCFVVAPPFRRHGVASALLDRVIADAAARGAAWIEGYPGNAPPDGDAGHFRGARSMFAARGFEVIEVRKHDTVMRRQP